MLHGPQRDGYPSQMRAVSELVQLSYPPVIVTLSPNPPCVLVKPFQMVASGLLEDSGHIGHVLEWGKLLNI